jgi:hypothetical protein
MKDKDGRRFYLPNTAPNLAGAELADLCPRGDREQRRAHHDEPESGTARGGRSPAHGERAVLATTPSLARICSPRCANALSGWSTISTIRPLNAFRGFKPAAGQEPENNVQLDVSALAYQEVSRAPVAPTGGVK